MIKSKFGPITNPKTGMSKDIVINALSKESLKDILTSSADLIKTGKKLWTFTRSIPERLVKT